MLVEMAVLFDAFHKRHAGETVFYTGSYLDMKTSIAGKDLGDALRVTVVLNVILFVLFKIIGGIMMRLPAAGNRLPDAICRLSFIGCRLSDASVSVQRCDSVPVRASIV